MSKQRIKVVFIAWVWPEPKASAAGVNLVSLINDCVAAGMAVVVASGAERTPLSYIFDEASVKTQPIAVNDAGFDVWIKGLSPDLVVFDRFLMEEQFGWRVREACPKALTVLDTEDLQCLREFRRQCSRGNSEGNSELGADRSLFSLDITKRELASIWRCDLTLVLSSFEYRLLVEEFKVSADLLYLRELSVQTDSEYSPKSRSAGRSFEARDGLIAIGNFRHAPNWDSILFIHSFWSRIRKRLPDVSIHIYGAYMPPKAQQLHKPQEGFHLCGWVDDAGAKMAEARVCLAPVRFGAGQKGKLLLAMCNGTPSVTTELGAESMVRGPWPGIVADEADDIINAVCDLYSSPKAWQQAHQQALTWVAERAGEPTGLWLDRCCQLTEHLSEHRHSNFIGAMLAHHQHQSTKYLSRWIEAKNSVTGKNQ